MNAVISSARSSAAVRLVSSSTLDSPIARRYSASLESMTSTPGATSRCVAMLVPESLRSSCSLRSATSSRAATRPSSAARLRRRPSIAGSTPAIASGAIALPLSASSSSCRRSTSAATARDTSWCWVRVVAASSAGAAVTTRSAWRDSSSEASAAGIRCWVMRPSTLPTSSKEYMAAAAAITANALMPRNASSRRPRTPKRCRSEPPPGSSALEGSKFVCRFRSDQHCRTPIPRPGFAPAACMCRPARRTRPGSAP